MAQECSEDIAASFESSGHLKLEWISADCSRLAAPALHLSTFNQKVPVHHVVIPEAQRRSSGEAIMRGAKLQIVEQKYQRKSCQIIDLFGQRLPGLS